MLKVNLSLGGESKVDPHEAIAKATKAKQIPTIEESWEKILGMKNSKKDLERLNTVKEQMELGNLGREEDKLHKAFSKAEALRLYKRYQESMREQRLEKIMNEDLELFPLVTSPEEIDRLVKGIHKANGVDIMGIEHLVSVDTETVGDAGGVDIYSERIAGWSLTYKIGDTYYNGYIPIEHYYEKSPEVWELDPRNVDYDIAINALIYVLKSDVETVWHNATFDMGLIYALTGVEPKGNVHDTMLLMHLLQEDRTEYGKNYKLKDLATEFLGIESQTFDEMFGKNAKFSRVPLKAARWYAAKDTWVGYKLFEWQIKILSKPVFAKILKAYLHIEMPCIRTTFHMEREGFILDQEELGRQREEAEKVLADIEDKLGKSDVFKDINLNSPSQLAEVIYDKLDLGKHLPKDVAKSRTTGSKTLAKLGKFDENVGNLVAYREQSKHLNSFINALPKFVAPDGKLHGSLSQSSTVTLRYTSSNPNLQQMSKPIRKVFRVDDNSVIIGADFSAQEMRVAAHISGCPDLSRIYNEGRDLYSETASSIFNKPLEECGDGSIYRKQAKVVVLAVLYGMGGKTLSDSLTNDKVQVSPEEAEDMINGFYKTYPRVEKWIKENQKQAKEKRFVETPWGTRRRFTRTRFDLLKKPWGALTEDDRKQRGVATKALRQATNAIVQGSAAMQTKQTMVALDKRLSEMNEARGADVFAMLSTIHDEVLVRAPKDVTREEVEAIREVMVTAVKLKVPSKTDMEIGNCWGKMVGVDEWFGDQVD